QPPHPRRHGRAAARTAADRAPVVLRRRAAQRHRRAPEPAARHGQIPAALGDEAPARSPGRRPMIRVHPASETLVEYASGALKTGGRLVLGLHLQACAACRDEVARLEAIGGALLAAEPEASLEPNALDRAL